MTSALKNRLVGTIIVVALVVILLPELLDGEKQVNNQAFLDVPEMPPEKTIDEVEKLDVETIKSVATRPMEIVDEEPVDDVYAPDSEPTDGAASAENLKDPEANTEIIQATESTTEQVTEPEPEIQVQDSGWVVQLGSFSNQANVKKLIRTLTNAGYRVYSRPIETKVGKLTKVFVGPELERSELEKAIPHLKELTGLTGKITEFEVSAQ
ncbi:SPOR domain-containing protein [Glaciecola sp. 1036]|uniref:SPOR domain-containing protein n=1 Tax=Alteromonadaceae TaxID=72275 RepID=UPI003D08FECF